jgi:hypothetical protein
MTSCVVDESLEWTCRYPTSKSIGRGLMLFVYCVYFPIILYFVETVFISLLPYASEMSAMQDRDRAD